MKTRALDSFKRITGDKLILGLVVLLIFLAGLYTISVIIALQPTELQVATRYTVFGETHFYRDKWYYLISFVLFGVMVAVIHTVLIIKLLLNDMRNFAVGFAWLSIVVIIIGWVLSHSVLGIAFLS
jgi:hypothetical protein